MRFLIGLILGLVIWPVGVWCYFRYGHPPVTVADKPFRFEREMAHEALHARIAAEMPKSVPMQATPDNLLAGAQTYAMNCSGCHGSPSHLSPMARNMYPRVPQLWQPHRNPHVVGVSDDPPGATYWVISNGVRLTGMPSFNQLLTSDQIWQVSLLLANADKPLPQPVMDALNKQ